jgi:hypothetical protein
MPWYEKLNYANRLAAHIALADSTMEKPVIARYYLDVRISGITTVVLFYKI